MWKDFFYYSKSERRVIILLLILATILVAANIYGLKENKNTYKDEPTSMPQLNSLGKDNNINRPKDKSPQTVSKIQNRSHENVHERTAKKKFDPNTATREELLQQGLSPYVTNNILKYRNKGGKFKTPSSLKKIYGMEQETFEEIEPRITISEEFKQHTISKPHYQKIEKFDIGTTVDLNTVDTATLKHIPGIGNILSDRIVKYRERLGGFHHIAQLQEIRGIDPSLNKWFEIRSTNIRKLAINRCSLEELKQHPYIGYHKARTIMDYQKRYGRIRDLTQLELFDTFSEADIEKLAPYLSFD